MATELERRALEELRAQYGSNAQFKTGQLEAILAVLNYSRVLVVQKTGWGKSLIYFMATKLLKERSELTGITCVISPLLSLIDNQIEAAEKFGLRAAKLNSSLDSFQKSRILLDLKNNQIDILFTTPETLNSMFASNSFDGIIIGLLVIDEAHCISDWGHDFRPDYFTFAQSFTNLASNSRIIATTATANNQVINDLKQQFGDELKVIRGDLERKALYQEVLRFPDDMHKLAWLYEHLADLKGQGVIYCQTPFDAESITRFLQWSGESCCAYHAQMSEEQAVEILKKFSNRETRVLVATSKLGMGFDKSDIVFVIHFNCPNNIISYYQQIGRAGRSLSEEHPEYLAHTVILSAPEDQEIIEYFISTSFPSREDAQKVFNEICELGRVRLKDLQQRVNLSVKSLKIALSYLKRRHLIAYDSNEKDYRSTGREFSYDSQHIEEVTSMRHREQDYMLELLHTDQCLTQFTLDSLNFKVKVPCNHCANCAPEFRLGENISKESRDKTAEYWCKYLPSCGFSTDKRKKWPDYKNIPQNLQVNDIWSLSYYGQPGLGMAVCVERNNQEMFSDYVFSCVVAFLKKHENMLPGKYAITYIPSAKRKHVSLLAERIADHFGLRLLHCFTREDNSDNFMLQGKMNNSFWQCERAIRVYSYTGPKNLDENILLFDDMFDSRWSITICGALLKQQGCRQVQPLTLACLYRSNSE